jgi:hypothetical protein
MSQLYTIIVPDSGPLLTLAAANSLDLLTRPGIQVLVPDGVYFETVRYPHMPGADDIVQWAKQAGDLVRIVPTETNAEAQQYLVNNPDKKRKRGLGEQCALEVVNDQSLAHPGTKSMLIYEDSDVTGLRLVRPNDVDTISTSDFLHLLEEARLIQSADHILDTAVAGGRPAHVKTLSAEIDLTTQAQFLADKVGRGR